MSEWIDINDVNKPAIGDECLIRIPVCKRYVIESGTYKGNGIWVGALCSSRGSGCSYLVSHWMPLPEPPK